LANRCIIIPELGRLKRGNTHPRYPELKYCMSCKRFKSKEFDFTSGKPDCKYCRNRNSSYEYRTNPKKREYHIRHQRETKERIYNPRVILDTDDFNKLDPMAQGFFKKNNPDFFK